MTVFIFNTFSSILCSFIFQVLFYLLVCAKSEEGKSRKRLLYLVLLLFLRTVNASILLYYIRHTHVFNLACKQGI